MLIYRRTTTALLSSAVEFEVEVEPLEEPRCRIRCSVAIRCPICGRRGRLGPPRHRVTWRFERGADPILYVREPVLCPNKACGWHVRIRAGIATDVPRDEEARVEPGLFDRAEIRGATPELFPV